MLSTEPTRLGFEPLILEAAQATAEAQTALGSLAEHGGPNLGGRPSVGGRMEVTRERAHRSWRSAERIKRLSDGLVQIGPFGLGIDGVLAWVPGAGPIYSVGAGGLLIYEAIQAGASTATLVRMGAYLALDSAASAIPVAGWAVDTLFRAHRMAGNALQKDIERRHGRPEATQEGIRGGEPEYARMRDVTPQRQ